MQRKLPPLGNIPPLARFLFGGDIGNHLSQINGKLCDLAAIQVETEGNNGILLSEHIPSRRELMRWINNEATAGANKKFGVTSTSENGAERIAAIRVQGIPTPVTRGRLLQVIDWTETLRLCRPN